MTSAHPIRPFWPFRAALPELGSFENLRDTIHKFLDGIYWQGVSHGALGAVIVMGVLLLLWLLFVRSEMGNGARVTVLAALIAIVLWYAGSIHQAPAVDPLPGPVSPAKPEPRKPRRPHRAEQEATELTENAFGSVGVETVAIGGPIGPDGKTEVICDLPLDQRTKNVGGRDGAGLCVFTSIGHAARYQNERLLADFQKKMRAEPGGGYPDKVDAMIRKYGAGAKYIQYEGGDLSILEAALKSGRMPGVTYNGHDPHYSGTIAHMVNLVYLDAQLACILDNNFVGERELVWMSRDDFLKRWKGRQQGWAVVLLAPPPPPVPKN